MKPMITLNVVDFPAPLGPITQTTSFSSTCSETPKRTWMLPYPAWTSRSSSWGMGPLPEVGLDHALVTLDRLGGPLRDLHAVVHHEDGLAVVHDDVHVVLDDENRLALLLKLVDVRE